MLINQVKFFDPVVSRKRCDKLLKMDNQQGCAVSALKIVWENDVLTFYPACAFVIYKAAKVAKTLHFGYYCLREKELCCSSA